MAAPNARHTRTEDEVLAAATAGHVMAGMPPTAADVDAARRVLRGESSVEEELAQMRDEFRRRRS